MMDSVTQQQNEIIRENKCYRRKKSLYRELQNKIIVCITSV